MAGQPTIVSPVSAWIEVQRFELNSQENEYFTCLAFI